jgi:hypothetical protein
MSATTWWLLAGGLGLAGVLAVLAWWRTHTPPAPRDEPVADQLERHRDAAYWEQRYAAWDRERGWLTDDDVRRRLAHARGNTTALVASVPWGEWLALLEELAERRRL